jgi:hypothetical protein
MSIGASRQVRAERPRARAASRETGRAKTEAPTPEPRVLGYYVLFSRAGMAVCTSQAQTRAPWRGWRRTRASDAKGVPARLWIYLYLPPVPCSGVFSSYQAVARPASKLESHVITTSDIIQTRVEHLKKSSVKPGVGLRA